MSDGQRGWILLFFLSIILIVVGINGYLGQVIAIVFCPQYITIGASGPISNPGNPNYGGGSSGNF